MIGSPRTSGSSPTGSAGEEVWSRISTVAEELQLASGEALPPVRELARRLGVKSTSVRDALLRAQGRGLVRIVPRVGAFWQHPAAGVETAAGWIEQQLPQALGAMLARGDQNVVHLLDARRLIEVELIGRAAERRHVEDLLPARRALEAMLKLPDDAPRPQHVEHDVRFHVELARLAGNGVLASVQRLLMELLQPYLNGVSPNIEGRTLAAQSHTAIYAAVVAGDAEAARRAMREHLSLAYDSLLQDLRKTPAIAPSSHV